jgi:hypothetical protein
MGRPYTVPITIRPGTRSTTVTTPAAPKHARYLRKQGVRATTTPHRAAHHIQRLRAAGMRDGQIAATAGRSPATLYRIAKCHTPTISRATEAAILAVPIPAQPSALAGRTATTHSHGTARRLQALVYAGYPPAWLATQLGMTRARLGDLLHQRRPAVTWHTAHHITALYLQHWHTPADAADITPADTARARALAERHQWAPAAAWDDIDHPGQRPDRGQHASRQAALIEDARELAAEGLSREGIIARLDGVTTWDAIRVACRRAGVDVPQVWA